MHGRHTDRAENWNICDVGGMRKNLHLDTKCQVSFGPSPRKSHQL